VDADSNWWGSASGPFKPESPDSNLLGTGTRVSPFVDYRDWLVVGPHIPPAPFSLVSPADLDTVRTWRVFLDWTDSSDPDCGGAVSYFIQYSTAVTFASFSEVGPRMATQDTLVVEFVPGRIYYWRIKAVDINGDSTLAVPNFRRFVTYAGGYPTAVGQDPAPPRVFSIRSSAPNPFELATRLEYAVPTKRRVFTTVIDVSGRTVRIIDLGVQEAGYHHVDWDGRTASGTRASAGVYFVQIRAGEDRGSVKLLLLR
jgi:hypothetical protein